MPPLVPQNCPLLPSVLSCVAVAALPPILRFVTGVVLDTLKGAVPVGAVEKRVVADSTPVDGLKLSPEAVLHG